MKILIFFSVSLLFQCRCVSEKKNVMFNFRFGNVCFCKMLLLNELKMQIETSFWLASKKSSLTKHMYIKTATIKYTNEYNPCSTVFPMSRYWTDSKSCKTQWFFWRNFRLCAQWIAIFFCPTGTVWFEMRSVVFGLTTISLLSFNNINKKCCLFSMRWQLFTQNYFWRWNYPGWIAEKLDEIVRLAKNSIIGLWLARETFT